MRGNGDVIGRCFDGHFWYAPACRANSSGCIPVITGGTGWSLNEMMQKAGGWTFMLRLRGVVQAFHWAKLCLTINTRQFIRCIMNLYRYVCVCMLLVMPLKACSLRLQKAGKVQSICDSDINKRSAQQFIQFMLVIRCHKERASGVF